MCVMFEHSVTIIADDNKLQAKLVGKFFLSLMICNFLAYPNNAAKNSVHPIQIIKNVSMRFSANIVVWAVICI